MSPPSCVVDPDYELVLRAQSGDTRAFDHLILKHADRLYGLVYRMTSHQEDAHDLVQDVFTKAYRSLSGFRGDASFHTWICRIAVRHTRRFLAHRRRTAGPSLQELLQSGHVEPAELVDQADAANPERQQRLHELQRIIRRALDGLSDAHRQVVMLYDLQGLPHGEIAARLGVSEGTVRSRLHYAHQQLQRSLRTCWDEGF
jgi:RNA polymerase sigma factor (sigma-70 family)